MVRKKIQWYQTARIKWLAGILGVLASGGMAWAAITGHTFLQSMENTADWFYDAFTAPTRIERLESNVMEIQSIEKRDSIRRFWREKAIDRKIDSVLKSYEPKGQKRSFHTNRYYQK